MDTEDYAPIVEAGAEGLVVYQETYNRGVYAEMHTAGPKRDFNYRLDCAERGYAAGFRRLGIGALIGLTRWQDEAVALAAHLEHLFKRCWQAQITVSVPRLRPAAGGFRPLFTMSDRELVQLVCALRITFPQVGIVLSTRERAPAARCARLDWSNDDERRQSYRTRRLHTTRPRTSASHCAWPHRRSGIPATAKTNSPPANSRSATNVPPPKSLLSFATEDSNRFGKIGIRFFAAYENFTQRRNRRRP